MNPPQQRAKNIDTIINIAFCSQMGSIVIRTHTHTCTHARTHTRARAHAHTDIVPYSLAGTAWLARVSIRIGSMRRGFLLKKPSAPAHAAYTTLPGSKHRYSAPEHVVFCLMASHLSYLTGETVSLKLCRDQKRLAGQLYHVHIANFQRIREGICECTPMGMMLHADREPNRLLVNHFYFRELGIHIVAAFFCMWRLVSLLLPRML